MAKRQERIRLRQLAQRVGRNIRRARKDKGWTQRKLCEATGMSTGFLSDVENGKRSLSVRKLVDIQAALGGSLDKYVIE